MDLGNQGIQDGFVGFCFLQKLVGVKQDLGAVGQLGGLAGVILQAVVRALLNRATANITIKVTG